jgi:hypothetical protein
MANKLALLAAIGLLLCSQALVKAQDDGRLLAKQLVNEARRLGIQIDPSRINISSVAGGGLVASVPLITAGTLNVTSQQLANGQVYVALQCMKTKTFNGCYRVRATGLVDNGRALGLSLTNGRGRSVSNSKVALTNELQSRRGTIVIEGPVDVYINGHYVGRFDRVVITWS